MKMKFTALALAFSFLNLFSIGCGSDNGNDPNNPKLSLNGKKPEDYYAQLYAQPQPDHYVRLLSSNFVYEPKFSNGDSAGVNLALKSDGTYKLIYNEFKPAESGVSGVILDKKREGKWRLQNDEIYFDDIASGLGIDINDQPGLQIKFLKPIGRQEGLQKAFLLKLSLSNNDFFKE